MVVLAVAVAVVAMILTGCARTAPLVVALPHVGLDDPTFPATLEAYAGSPLVGGNRVAILLNGDEIYAAQLDAIREARSTITYSQYFWGKGAIGAEVADALGERCRAGVGVSILLDGIGALTMPDDQLAILERSGCHVAWFRPLHRSLFTGRVNHRNHRRILVVDGRVAFTGGAGVSDKWTGNGRQPGHWRDTDVRVEGPAVRFLQAAFLEHWVEATGLVLGGKAYFPALRPQGATRAAVITSSPAAGEFAMYTALLLAVDAARRSILITNPYFLPDARLEQALFAAVNRGVRVRVLAPGEIDHNVVRHASRHAFGPLLRRGVEIYEYRGGLLHAKTLVVDGVWSWVGTANLDNRSFALNAEIAVVMQDRTVARRLEEIFADDLRFSRPLDLRVWQARPLWQRTLELLALPFREQM